MYRVLHNLWVRCGRAAEVLALLPLCDHETLQYPPLQQGLIVQHSCDADGHTPTLRQHTKAQRQHQLHGNCGTKNGSYNKAFVQPIKASFKGHYNQYYGYNCVIFWHRETWALKRKLIRPEKVVLVEKMKTCQAIVKLMIM